MEISDRLATALGGRYELKEEIGRGAAAIVFRALDLRHARPVALKVLRPEVALGVGSERFLREIEISARLTHPHILPLYESGQADGLLFFVMPFVEGESLRERMNREGPLPLEEALEITEQIAEALQHAHDHRILHRDVKPENIMLSGNQAFLADLGIARAMGEAGTDHLTRTGLAVGTPLYMSPEQASGLARLDGRADIYSLACVLFEMLSGEPPFNGPTAQAVLAKHAMEAVPSLRVMRSAMSASIEMAIRRALEKTPADRYPTPQAFAENLRSAYTESRLARETLGPSPRGRWWPAAWTIGGIAVGALVFWLFNMGPLARGPDADPQLMAVLPFDLDPALDATFLSTASVAEAVSARFTGEGGPRAAPSELVLGAWERERGPARRTLAKGSALRVAGEVGAGLVLSGRVHREGDTPVIEARVLSVHDGRELAAVEDLEWPPGNLEQTLDQLTIRLLAQFAGETALIEDLAHRELPAVRALLEGLRDFGAGLYSEAFDALARALAVDSTLAQAGLAGLRVEEASRSSGPLEWQVAYAHRDRLSPRDSAHLGALLGLHASGLMDYATRVWAWDYITLAYPDDEMSAYFHGKALLEAGGMTPHESPLLRARESMLRAIELRPGFVPALEGLLEVASILRDSSEVVRVARVLTSLEPKPDHVDRARWRWAVVTGDTATLLGLRSRFPELSLPDLEWIIGMAQLTGEGLDDAWHAAEVYRSRVASRVDLFGSSVLSRTLALNLGKPLAAARFETSEPFTVPLNNLLFILEALFWDGDQARAEVEVVESRAMLLRPGRSAFAYSMDHCSLALWGLSLGDTAGVQPAIESLRAWEPETPLLMIANVCAAVLEVERALLTGSPDLRHVTEELETLMRPGPRVRRHLSVAANLTLARAFEALGERERALAAVRRRPHDPKDGPIGLATLFREEGRLATLVARTGGAMDAYRHYLTLRWSPEGELRTQADSVRSALERLEAGGS